MWKLGGLDVGTMGGQEGSRKDMLIQSIMGENSYVMVTHSIHIEYSIDCNAASPHTYLSSSSSHCWLMLTLAPQGGPFLGWGHICDCWWDGGTDLEPRS